MTSLSTIEMISASAGTGKTYRLTELIVEAVAAGTAPERIMATTFTVKAARELKSRVRSRLMKEAAPDLAPRIEDAYVGTVHSLCSRFLSEYAIDAGISPALDMLPEQDAERLFNIAVEEAISYHAQEVEDAARRLGRTGEGYGFGQQSDWQEDVRELVTTARANGFSPTELEKEAEAALKLWWQVVSADGDGRSDHSFGPTPEKLVSEIEAALEEIAAIPEPTKGTQKAAETLKAIREGYTNEKELRWRDWLTLSKITGTKETEPILETLRQTAVRLFRTEEFRKDFETLVSGAYRCAADALTLFQDYKHSRGLMDFGDLEVSFLKLISGNESVRDGLRGRVDLVLVDEFQDTSPVQLAIFLQMHEIIGRSIWVGDPKQAIYGFRGTDPSLMSSVAEHLEIKETLQSSWRSRKRLIEFTNALFTQAFHQIPEERVRLEVPAQRADEAKGGTLAAWYLDSKNQGEDAEALAAGVVELLETDPDLTPGDIAILCRTNPSCKSVAEALEARGVRAGVASGSLIAAREVQLVLAALRYLADRSDTIALTELLLLTPSTDSGAGDKQLLSALLEKPEETIAAWREEPVAEAIEGVRAVRERLSPREALDAVIAAAGVMKAGDRWSRTDLRRANIERLRQLVDEYEELRRSSHSPATVLGFVEYLEALEAGQAEGDASTGCVVSTYHGAKGLEWPVVIMADLNKNYVGRMFGVTTVPASHFDPRDPLANRGIRYWPWPFGLLKKAEALEELLQATPEQSEIVESQKAESQRLLYVGMTRARDRLVLALRNQSKKGFAKPEDEWLKLLSDENGTELIEWPHQQGEATLPVGAKNVPIEIRSHDPESEASLSKSEEPAVWRPVVPAVTSRAAVPPRRITPSSAEASGGVRYRAVELDRIGEGLQAEAKEARDQDAEAAETTDLGNALHAVLALAPAFRGRDPELVDTKIASILEGWGISDIEPPAVGKLCSALDSFLRSRYGAAQEQREWPVHLRLPNHQELRGWVDLLLDTPEGWVIVDHKAYRGDRAAEVAAGFGAQLGWYRKALKAAGDKPVREALIHFPLLGKMFRVEEQ